MYILLDRYNLSDCLLFSDVVPKECLFKILTIDMQPTMEFKKYASANELNVWITSQLSPAL